MVQTNRQLMFGIASALVCISATAAKKPSTAMDQRQRAIHALNRLTFGPRPGDPEHLVSLGVDRWIEMQLHPESINDHALDARLEPFRTLRMSPAELAENFPSPDMISRVAVGNAKLPGDKNKRAIYEALLEGYREKQAKSDDTDASTAPKGSMTETDPFSEMTALPPEQRVQALLGMSIEEQCKLVASLKGPRRAEFLAGMSPVQRDAVIALDHPQLVAADDLRQSKVLRATYSERQLQEVMTDFWLNHFNVFVGKGIEQYQLTSYERDVIRPHTLGKFEDLLVAVARSPAMLFYLDNWVSVGPDSPFAKTAALSGVFAGLKRRSKGLNENYGRELMELHTLGVKGGYTQRDVTEVAKAFTGWTVTLPREGGNFQFDQRRHEPGPKVVLGREIKEGGEKEGYEVLHILAREPSTARFICSKLAVRFVSDDPPQSLVDRMSRTFLKKDGDIREVLRTMLRSPEFWEPDNYHARIKTPLEFVVSALRATNADVSDATALAGQLRRLGMPLYGEQAPTGYSMNSNSWVSSSALLERLNFAMRLASGHIPGVHNSACVLAPNEDRQQLLSDFEQRLLAGNVPSQTHETIAARLSNPEKSDGKPRGSSPAGDCTLVEGLLIGSPEFQRR